jgi:hypothetical protein
VDSQTGSNRQRLLLEQDAPLVTGLNSYTGDCHRHEAPVTMPYNQRTRRSICPQLRALEWVDRRPGAIARVTAQQQDTSLVTGLNFWEGGCHQQRHVSAA